MKYTSHFAVFLNFCQFSAEFLNNVENLRSVLRGFLTKKKATKKTISQCFQGKMKKKILEVLKFF